jgi:hypothetical protein
VKPEERIGAEGANPPFTVDKETGYASGLQPTPRAMASITPAISLGRGDMKVTLDDIRKKFDALESGEESREDIADFAFRAMKESRMHISL